MWIGIDWIDLRLFSYLLILVISEITLKSFEINSKSLSNLSFPEVNSIFGVAISKKDSSSVIFRNYFFDWFELFSNDWSSTFQMYRPNGIIYATYRDCNRTLMTQPHPIMLNFQSSKMESVEKLLKMVFSVKTEETYTRIKIRP